jgi:hypothetical protein
MQNPARSVLLGLGVQDVASLLQKQSVHELLLCSLQWITPRQQIWLSGRKMDVNCTDCATLHLSILRTRTTKNFKFDAQRVMRNEVKNLEKWVRLKKEMQFYFPITNHYKDR